MTPAHLAERLHERRCERLRAEGKHGPGECEQCRRADSHWLRYGESGGQCGRLVLSLVPWSALPDHDRASRLADAAEVLAVIAEEPKP